MLFLVICTLKKFKDCMDKQKMPAAINIVRIRPLRGKAILMMEADLAFSLVESYFGGTGQYKAKMEEREFTIAEKHILQLVSDIMYKDLVAGWSPIMDVEIEQLSTEVNPQLVNVMPADDVMLVYPFQFTVCEQVNNLSIVLPYSVLEPFRDVLDMGGSSAEEDVDHSWQTAMQEDVMSVSLTLSSILVKKEMTVRDILNFKVGSVIPVELPETVYLDIESVPSFKTKFGLSNDKCALKIIERVSR